MRGQSTMDCNGSVSRWLSGMSLTGLFLAGASGLALGAFAFAYDLSVF